MRDNRHNGQVFCHSNLAAWPVGPPGVQEGMADGPAFSGKVHIKVVRADELRTHLGRAPAPMVMLRVSVGGVAQPDLMKTTPKPGETSPEYGEEFVLNVSDARSSQLECTIWDTSDPQVTPVSLNTF